MRWSLSLLLLGLVFVPEVSAHPIPRLQHDRAIVVRLEARPHPPLRVIVDYQLDVDEFTVVYVDLPALIDKAALRKLQKPAQFYEAFLEGYAPILAGNLRLQVDGQEIQLGCLRKSYTQKDEKGLSLGHLRATFVYAAQIEPVWPRLALWSSSLPGLAGPANLLLTGLLDEGGPSLDSKGFRLARYHRLVFREDNYVLEEGAIRLSLDLGPPIEILTKSEPDETLKAKPLPDLKPGDDDKLRQAWVEFIVNESPALATLPQGVAAGSAPGKEPMPGAAQEPAPPSSAGGQDGSGSTLSNLLLDSERGIIVLLTLAAVFGAAHALTPGHGKTLVAAYLVGERGTAFHALFLGLVTTVTHTGAVLALAALLLFVFPKAVPRDVQFLLGLVGGLLVAGMGLWLLLRRLTGGADHFHLPGHGHHHGHTHPISYHEEHAGASGGPPQPSIAGGWWGLLVLGFSGGIVPCWDAILMLGFAISAQRLWLGVPLLLAFSAGLAAVLIAIGLAVVYVKGFASSHWGDKGLVRALPIISAVLVTAMGIWLCYSTVHLPQG